MLFVQKETHIILLNLRSLKIKNEKRLYYRWDKIGHRKF